MSDALQIVWWIADAGWVVLLPIAQHAMAVATDGHFAFIECFTRDVVKLQSQWIIEATERTSRVVRP